MPPFYFPASSCALGSSSWKKRNFSIVLRPFEISNSMSSPLIYSSLVPLGNNWSSMEKDAFVNMCICVFFNVCLYINVYSCYFLIFLSSMVDVFVITAIACDHKVTIIFNGRIVKLEVDECVKITGALFFLQKLIQLVFQWRLEIFSLDLWIPNYQNQVDLTGILLHFVITFYVFWSMEFFVQIS